MILFYNPKTKDTKIVSKAFRIDNPIKIYGYFGAFFILPATDLSITKTFRSIYCEALYK